MKKFASNLWICVKVIIVVPYFLIQIGILAAKIGWAKLVRNE